MGVVGWYTSIISNTGRTSDIGPFTSDFVVIQMLPIVDAAIISMCPYTDKPYILTVRNSPSVTFMTHNLWPPFILI